MTRTHPLSRSLSFSLGVGLLIALSTTGPSLAQPAAAVPAATPTAASPLSPLSPWVIAQIDAYLEQARVAADAPGLSAAVALDGQVVYAGGKGHADVGNRVPATEHTVHNIGSVSKVNAVVAIMALVEDGAVELDLPIQTWVPSFPAKDPPITLRHILNHTSGIRHYNADDFGGETFSENKERYETIEESLAIFADDELLFPPGSYWSYSSYATNLLQAVIERTTDTDFESFMRTRVWQPAGMLSSSFDVPERIVRNRARGYRRDPESGRLQHEPYGDISYKFAGGGMLSTAVDQVRLGIALNHGLLLDEQTLELMYTPWAEPRLGYRPDGEPRELDFQQALLWRVGHDDEGRRHVSHSGSVRGFRTSLINYPEEDLVVAVMINIASNPTQHAQALADLVLGLLETTSR